MAIGESNRYFETGVKIINPPFLVEGGTVTYKDIGFDKIVSLDVGVSFTLPLISSLAHEDFFINVENNTTDTVTVIPTGSDTIQGEVTQTISPGSNMKLRINGTNYRFN